MNEQILNFIKTLFDGFAIILSSIAIYISVKQTKIQRKSFTNDYERSRREKAVDILMQWHSKLDKTNSAARKFAETLSDENLQSISNGEKFEIPDTDKNRTYISVLFEKQNTNEEKNKTNSSEVKDKQNILITAAQSTEIRWKLITYLNILENVVSAWKYNIVDRNLIEAEFKYMFDHKDGALKRFREIQVDAYPCRDLFELEMKNKYTAKISKDYEKL